jgi:hypothetical protein
VRIRSFSLILAKIGPSQLKIAQLVGMRLSGKPCLNPPLLISGLPLLLGPVVWELSCIPLRRQRSRPVECRSIREPALAGCITMWNLFLSKPTDQTVWLDSTEAF